MENVNAIVTINFRWIDVCVEEIPVMKFGKLWMKFEFFGGKLLGNLDGDFEYFETSTFHWFDGNFGSFSKNFRLRKVSCMDECDKV